jgi:hypothetical protein
VLILVPAALASVTAGLVGLEHLALNLLLPRFINQHPERIRVEFDWAQMIVPGEVEVRGLRLRGQTPGEQWSVTADHVIATVSLEELRHQRFHASEVVARGLTFHMRHRHDRGYAGPAVADGMSHQVHLAATGEGPIEDLASRGAATADPPIPGLHNPPDPRPEDIYAPAPPWEVRVDDIEATELREVWVNGLRLRGDSRAHVTLFAGRPYFDLDAQLDVESMRADLGEAALAEGIHGEVSLTLAGMDRTTADDERLATLSGRAKLGVDVKDLRSLDRYLEALPWLRLSGVGHAELDLGFDGAQVRPGSHVRATFPDLLLRVLDNDVIGSGIVQAEVGPDAAGEPESRVSVRFDDFWIIADGGASRIVEGTGLRVTAHSPETALDRPASAVEVRLDLPESRVPDISAFNTYLPADVGLSLDGGSGTVHGHLRASSEDATASGDLYVEGDDIGVHFDRYAIKADLSVHAQLTEAQLALGHYDIAGSVVELREGGIAAGGGGRRPSRRWSATLEVLAGSLDVGAKEFLDTTLRVKASDSAPFVLIIADRRSLPRWVQDRMTVSGVSGDAHLKLGDGSISVQPCQVRGGGHRVDLRYRRRGQSASGALLFRSGSLSVGVALLPDGPQLQLFNAKRWFFGITD